MNFNENINFDFLYKIKFLSFECRIHMYIFDFDMFVMKYVSIPERVFLLCLVVVRRRLKVDL